MMFGGEGGTYAGRLTWWQPHNAARHNYTARWIATYANS